MLLEFERTGPVLFHGVIVIESHKVTSKSQYQCQFGREETFLTQCFWSQITPPTTPESL